ncbi:hypothetical protein E4T42_06419 [Aureobasidium subglaciale]|nr:hypothetical protein E4T42_06419 [Aureobasidium subglaciale]
MVSWWSIIFRKSHVEQLVLETDPRARLLYLERQRTIYSFPLLRLFPANRQKTIALGAQIEELQYLIQDRQGRHFSRYRNEDDDDDDPSPPSSVGDDDEPAPAPQPTLHEEEEGEEEEGYLQRTQIALLADQQAARMSTSMADTGMLPYSQPVRRYLRESPRVQPRESISCPQLRLSESSGQSRSRSLSHSLSQRQTPSLRHSRSATTHRLPPENSTSSDHMRLASLYTEDHIVRDLEEPRPQARDTLSRISEESSAQLPSRRSKPRRSSQGRPKPPASVGPPVVLERESRHSDRMIFTEPSLRVPSGSRSHGDPSRRSRRTGLASKSWASGYPEQIHIRPEMRDPNSVLPGVFGGGFPSF